MPPRVTYWTGVWDPGREALSKEVEVLRRALAPRATVVSFSVGNARSAWQRAGVWKLASRHGLAFRALAPFLEWRGDVSHAFGAMNAWHLLRALGRRPLLLTVAIPGPALDPAMYRKVSLFVAETEPLAKALATAGIPAERVRLIYPGVDLAVFRPAPFPPPKPFRVLFASTPADPAEFDARGVTLLVEVARRAPDVEIIMPWRRWGDSAASQRALDALVPPPNVRIERRNVEDMAGAYAGAHAVVCLFAEGFGKSCPNSIVEGLACGRPALVARTCGIAELVGRAGAGIVTPRETEAVVRALRRLAASLEEHSQRARVLAEKVFGIDTFRRSYAEIYEDLAARPLLGLRPDSPST